MDMSILRCAIAVGLLAAPVGASAATTISITGGSAGVCTSKADGYCYMNQAFGDTNAVDVSYETTDAAGTVTKLAHRTINFGDLGNTIGAGTNEKATSFGKITLAAKTGYQISLLDFDFAQYLVHSPTVPISISDLGGKAVLSGIFSTGSGSSHANLSVNSAFGSGVVIRWGPGANVVGLDNIRYDVRAIAAAVPEPASWAMLILGFGLIGGGLRMKRSASPALAT